MSLNLIVKSFDIKGRSLKHKDVKYWQRIDYIEYVTEPMDFLIKESSFMHLLDKHLLLLEFCGDTTKDGLAYYIIRYKYIWQPENHHMLTIKGPGGCCGKKRNIIAGLIDVNRIFKVGDKIGEID